MRKKERLEVARVLLEAAYRLNRHTNPGQGPIRAKIEDYPTAGWGAGPKLHNDWKKARAIWVKKLQRNVKLDRLAKVDFTELGLDGPDRKWQTAFASMVLSVFDSWVFLAAKGEKRDRQYVRAAQGAYDLFLGNNLKSGSLKNDFEPMMEILHQDAVYDALFELGDRLRSEHPMFKNVPVETYLRYPSDSDRYF